MKKNSYILLVLLAISVSITATGQSLFDQNSDIINQYFQTGNTVLSNPTATTQKKNPGIEPQIIITQTGNYNYSYIESNSNKKQDVNQQGDYNNYEYYSYYDSNTSQVNTLQNGNNNDVQIYGQNELAKEMTIIQNTNNQTLIIKNY